MVVVAKNRHRENVLLHVSRRRSLRLHSLAQKEAGHLMNPTHWGNLILIFLRFPPDRKKKQSTWFVCKWVPRGALKPVYFTYFIPNLSTLEEQLVQSTLIFITPLWSFQNSKHELAWINHRPQSSVKHSSIFSLFFLSNCVPFVFIL